LIRKVDSKRSSRLGERRRSARRTRSSRSVSRSSNLKTGPPTSRWLASGATPGRARSAYASWRCAGARASLEHPQISPALSEFQRHAVPRLVGAKVAGRKSLISARKSWFRGRATAGTCRCGAGRREAEPRFCRYTNSVNPFRSAMSHEERSSDLGICQPVRRSSESGIWVWTPCEFADVRHVAAGTAPMTTPDCPVLIVKKRGPSVSSASSRSSLRYTE
jgi:hypothetical protein